LASRSLRCEGLEDRRLLSISPVGNQFQVHSYPGGSQLTSRVAMDPSGGYVAVWDSEGEDGSGKGIYAMRFDAAGNPLLRNASAIAAPSGNPYEFRVNTFTADDQWEPDIAIDDTGDFVITWTSKSQAAYNNYSVYAQRFNSAGAPQGSEFRVNSGTGTDQRGSQVDMDPSGNFVVTWQSIGSNFTYSIFARRYNAAGAAQGSQLTVASGGAFTGPYYVGSHVSVEDDGDFVIAYNRLTSAEVSSSDVRAKRYDAAGNSLGEITVTNLSEAQFAAFVDTDSVGNFTIIWQSKSEDSSGGYGVYGQRYNSSGTALGGRFLINGTTSGNQALATMAMEADGDFTVTWMADGQDGSGYGIYARRFNASAVPQGAEFLVNTSTAGNQIYPQIALNDNGNQVVVWANANPTGVPADPWLGTGIFARRYQTNLNPTANAGGPYTLVSGSPLTLNGSASSDPEGQPLTYSWTINGITGATGVGPTIPWATLASTYGLSPAGGNYNVTVQVNDGYGGVTTSSIVNLQVTAGNLPPVANAGGPYTINEGQNLTLNASGSSDPNLDPLTYSWDLDGDGFDDATGVNPTIPWATLVGLGRGDGTVTYASTIRVRVDDGQGGVTESVAVDLTVNNVLPTASAGGPYSVIEGQSLTLNGSASDPAGANDPLTYAWDLNNDGNYADALGVSPTLTWAQLVSFGISDGPATLSNRIRLRVGDGDGFTFATPVDLSVINAPPTANAGGPYTVIEGQSLTLDGSLSSDPAGAADPLNYNWDLNFDGIIDVTGVAPVLSWSYLVSLGLNDDPAALTQVRLQVDDSEGGVSISPLTSITVVNAPPTADAGGPYAITEGQSLTLNGSGSDPAGAADPLTYSWDINGDGIFGDAIGAAPIVPWSTLAGLNIDGNGNSYNVKVRVSDGDGGVTDSVAVTLTVTNAPPTADAGGPYTIVEGQSLVLNGSLSSDPAGANDPLTYSWDLDGDNDFDDASGVNPTILWATLVGMGYADGPGTFSGVIRVRVDDGDGGVSESTAVDLTVDNAPPTADAGGPYTITEGQSLDLNGSGSDPAGAADTLTYAWDIDGDDDFDDAVGAAPSLTWNDLVGFGISDGTGATYTLKLRVSDEDGGFTESSALLTVDNAPPTADAGGPYAITEGQSLALSGSGSDPAGAADPLTYSWDINGDGIFGDALGAAPIVPWATLASLNIDGNGTPYNAKVRVSDDDGGFTDSAAVTLTVDNAPPTADAGGPYTVVEGQALVLNGSLSSDPAGANDPLTYSWDLDGDGFDDATGVNPSVPWATLVGMGYSDGPGTFSGVIRVRVDDGDGGVSESTAVDLTVTNAAPTAGISGPASTARNASANFTLTATDPAAADQSAGFTFTIDWNGDGSDIQVVNGASGLVVAHTFTSVGARTIKVTATDKDGGISTQATLSVATSAVQVVSGDLIWTGTAGDDSVSFEDLGGGDIRVTTTLDNGLATNFVETISGVTGIVNAKGLAGNDTLDASLLGDISATLDGGTGNNTLYGGDGNDILIGGGNVAPKHNGPEGQQGSNIIVGGAGDDTIYGNAVNGAEGKGGNNILVGGDGNDTIYGNWTDGGEGGGRNIIVGGADADTLYDYKIADGAEGKGSILVADELNVSLGVPQLQQIMAEWSSTHTYSDRVNNILGPGSVGRLNGNAYLQPGTTVTSDAAIDQLWGTTSGTAFNWFLYTLAVDEINRDKVGETKTTL
jgi:hypothetical protein